MSSSRIAILLTALALCLLPASLPAEEKSGKSEPRLGRLEELPADARTRMGSVRLQCDGPVGFTPDGCTLIAASFWSVGFWDVSTGEKLRRIAAPLGGRGRQLALAP